MTFTAHDALANSVASCRTDVGTSAAPWILGIDPGASGALAAVRADLSSSRVLKMPMLDKHIDIAELRRFLGALMADGGIRYALIEKSQVMPSQGAVSGFTYGRSYGTLTTSLEFLGVPFVECPPAKWKLAVIGAGAKAKASRAAATNRDDTKASLVDPLASAEDLKTQSKKAAKAANAAHKKALKQLAVLTARRLFPLIELRATEDGKAEALLMAEAARRIYLNGSMSAVVDSE